MQACLEQPLLVAAQAPPVAPTLGRGFFPAPAAAGAAAVAAAAAVTAASGPGLGKLYAEASLLCSSNGFPCCLSHKKTCRSGTLSWGLSSCVFVTIA